MRVLVACEYSGRVRNAFRKLGHDAWSCDLEPSDDNSPYHYHGDVQNFLWDGDWDLLIGHPPCTYLTNAGARWFKHPDIPKDHPPRRDMPHPQYPNRWHDRDDAIDFFLLLADCPIPKKCLENSKPSRYAMGRVGRYDQVVHPWHFGENYSKGACLWLQGLDPLVATHTREDYDEPPQQKCWTEAPGPDRWKRRSTTYQSVADAMAEQWGTLHG